MKAFEEWWKKVAREPDHNVCYASMKRAWEAALEWALTQKISDFRISVFLIEDELKNREGIK